MNELFEYPPGPHYERNEVGYEYQHPGYAFKYCRVCAHRYPIAVGTMTNSGLCGKVECEKATNKKE